MTPEQAEALLDAVIECRRTSRWIMTAEGAREQCEADAADDEAYRNVLILIKEATVER